MLLCHQQYVGVCTALYLIGTWHSQGFSRLSVFPETNFSDEAAYLRNPYWKKKGTDGVYTDLYGTRRLTKLQAIRKRGTPGMSIQPWPKRVVAYHVSQTQNMPALRVLLTQVIGSTFNTACNKLGYCLNKCLHFVLRSFVLRAWEKLPHKSHITNDHSHQDT